uniref:Uncharacterized protein n=1 Tax=Setaria italica TaxID=4555 RepID=K4AMZ6_SETIT
MTNRENRLQTVESPNISPYSLSKMGEKEYIFTI